jgi:hypothetical protein
VAEDEDEGGGAVIDDSGGFCAGEEGEGFFEKAATGAARSSVEIELEVMVGRSDRSDVVGDGSGEGGTAEVGVDEDAGGIDDWLDAGAREGGEIVVQRSDRLIEAGRRGT